MELLCALYAALLLVEWLALYKRELALALTLRAIATAVQLGCRYVRHYVARHLPQHYDALRRPVAWLLALDLGAAATLLLFDVSPLYASVLGVGAALQLGVEWQYF